MKVCTIIYSLLSYALASFFQFATLVLAALVAMIVTASKVAVRAPVELEGRVRILPLFPYGFTMCLIE